jgi:aminoglycoside 2'-N-acetyltransferase I
MTLESSLVHLVVARTEDLDEPTRAEIIEVCIAASGEPDFHNLFRYVPSGGRHVMAYDGGRIVGHAMATTRWLHVGTPGTPTHDRRLKTAYIDAVATHPDWHHRGVGSAVMRRLADEIDDHEIGGLETEVRGFYEPLGWELWRGALAGLRDGELALTPDQTGIMVLRLAPTRDLDLDGPLTIEVNGRIW